LTKHFSIASPALAVALCAIAGAAVGVAGAFAAYSPPFRPLAHTLGMWLLLTALVSARRPVRQAILFATTALLTAVPAFYAGKALIYDARHPGGSTSIDESTVVLWLVLALFAGPLLGALFHRIGTTDRLGALSSGAAVGLLVADAARRALRYPNQTIALLVFLSLALAALWLRARPLTRDQLPALLLALPVAALCGYLLVSTPDLLEDLL
jgi:hypothetical protein